MDICNLAVGQTVRLRPEIIIPTGQRRQARFLSPHFVEATITASVPGSEPYAVLVALPLPGPWTSPQWAYPADLHPHHCGCETCQLDIPRDPMGLLGAAMLRPRSPSPQ